MHLSLMWTWVKWPEVPERAKLMTKHKSGKMILRCASCAGAEEGRISGQYGAYFVLVESIRTIVRSENPFVSPLLLRLCRSPRLGAILVLAMQ